MTDPDRHRRKYLGDVLIDAGHIDENTLRQALEEQKSRGKRLGEILREDGLVSDEAIARALGRMFRAPFVRLEDARVNPEVLGMVPPRLARVHHLVPVKRTRDGLYVATANPSAFYDMEKELRFVAQMPIHMVVAAEDELERAIDRLYPDRPTHLESQPALVEFTEIEGVRQDNVEGIEDVIKLAGLPPVVRFINSLFAEAIMVGASDIHIEPRRDDIEIRFRVDGILRPFMRTSKKLQLPVISRTKVIANLDISVHRTPQDGKARIRFGESLYDMRISTLPAFYGEKITIRILNPAQARLNPEDVGFSPRDLRRIQQTIALTRGIILVTGPTGSGKTSTLYAFLNRLNTPEVNIITVEDPVEFDVAGLTQVQINPKGGVTFAAALRSILRQDPDIVMVGEIRDRETAETAVQAAQTGHLVLSTLHTNDAPSAISRLIDLGVDPRLLADSVLAVLGQRLARKVCTGCTTEYTPAPDVLERIRPWLVKKEPVFRHGAGCKNCDQTGYKGRIGIFELLSLSQEVQNAVGQGSGVEAIRRAAEQEGFQTLFQDGLAKALQGLTTIEEILRVAPPMAEPSAQAVPAPTLEVTAPDREPPPSGPKPSVHTLAPPYHGSALAPTATGRVPSAPSRANTPRNGWTVDRTPPLIEQEPPALTPQAPTVLIVDDNEEVLIVLKRFLKADGVDVQVARDGAEGFEAAVRLQPDLIITDYKMPVMDGIALIRRLDEDRRSRGIPVIMLTALDEIESEVEVLNAGAVDYLVKPVDRRRFLARVKRYLPSAT